MIPKTIHYCWFGPNNIPDQLQEYIKTWKIFCPDYEIKLWNEESFDIDSQPFTKSAYEAKKYAFVSDYVRAYALYHEGGIYLDTDVEIKRNLDVFLNHQSFSGRECSGVAFTSAVWGAEPHHSLTKKVLAFYDNRKYVEELEAPNTSSISKILAKDYGIDLDTNKLEVGLYKQDSIHIYPAEYFCLDRMPNYTTHHFYGSWLDEDIDYKSVVDFEANFFRGL